MNFKINSEQALLDQINLIDKRFAPDLWITDTGSILSKCRVLCPKATFKHSVTYKKYFLDENIFQYQYVFIPGEYHYNRIMNKYPNNNSELKKNYLLRLALKFIPF